MTTTLPSVDAIATPTITAMPEDGPSGVRHAVLRDGTRVVVRPIRPDDADRERRFIEALSPQVRRFRFLDTINIPSADLLRQMTVVDPATGVAYVAVIGAGSQEQQIGVARFSAEPAGPACEFAVTVSDAWQGKGLGTVLMRRLVEEARRRGIDTLHSSDAADNELMRRFAAHLQLQHYRDPQDATMVLYSLDVRLSTLLDAAPAPGTEATQTPGA